MQKTMEKAFLAITAAVSLGFLASPALAAGDAQAGAGKAATCFACHGNNGAAPIMPNYPKLNGQNAQYLENTLKGYKDGSRTGGEAAVMTAQVASLSEQDLADLAAFFASVK